MHKMKVKLIVMNPESFGNFRKEDIKGFIMAGKNRIKIDGAEIINGKEKKIKGKEIRKNLTGKGINIKKSFEKIQKLQHAIKSKKD